MRAKVGVAEDLNPLVAEGVLDLSILYTPQHGPGLEVEFLIREKLVLVTIHPDPERIIETDYVYVGWGSDFALHHGLSFPDMTDPGLFVGLGPLALNYILEVGGSGYFRMSAVQPFLNTGALRLVPNTPEFSCPAYAVYGTNAEPTLIRKALDGLRKVAISDTEPADK